MRLLEQLKQRREPLGLRQEDMELRVGMKRQQYQRTASEGDPRPSTRDPVAQGLEGEIVVSPRERLRDVKALLQQTTDKITGAASSPNASLSRTNQDNAPAIDDPWEGILD